MGVGVMEVGEVHLTMGQVCQSKQSIWNFKFLFFETQNEQTNKQNTWIIYCPKRNLYSWCLHIKASDNQTINPTS